jgi:hypothetical protein
MLSAFRAGFSNRQAAIRGVIRDTRPGCRGFIAACQYRPLAETQAVILQRAICATGLPAAPRRYAGQDRDFDAAKGDHAERLRAAGLRGQGGSIMLAGTSPPIRILPRCPSRLRPSAAGAEPGIEPLS